MQRVEVIGRIDSLNWYRNAHFYQLNKSKQEWSKQISYAIKKAGVRQINIPLVLHVTTFTKRQRDVDGTIIGAKYMLDTLVQMGLLPDDNPKYVQTIILNWQKAEGEEKVVYLLQ